MTKYFEHERKLYAFLPDPSSDSGCEPCAFNRDRVGCHAALDHAPGKPSCCHDEGYWALVGEKLDLPASKCGKCEHQSVAGDQEPCKSCAFDPEVPKGYYPKFQSAALMAVAKPFSNMARVDFLSESSKVIPITPVVDQPLVTTAVVAQEAPKVSDNKKDSNPKTAIGDKKVPLALLSPIAEAHWSLAQFAGMCKYQAWNWRIAGVRTSTYVSAMRRHLAAWLSGEQLDPTDGTHHLGNIMACAAILLDAEAAGKLTDDRPPSVDVRPTYAFVEQQMAVLKEKYAHIEQKPFTIQDMVS